MISISRSVSTIYSIHMYFFIYFVFNAAKSYWIWKHKSCDVTWLLWFSNCKSQLQKWTAEANCKSELQKRTEKVNCRRKLKKWTAEENWKSELQSELKSELQSELKSELQSELQKHSWTAKWTANEKWSRCVPQGHRKFSWPNFLPLSICRGYKERKEESFIKRSR